MDDPLRNIAPQSEALDQRIELEWCRNDKAMQVRITYSERHDAWDVEWKRMRSDNYVLWGRTDHVWKVVEELAEALLR